MAQDIDERPGVLLVDSMKTTYEQQTLSKDRICGASYYPND